MTLATAPIDRARARSPGSFCTDIAGLAAGAIGTMLWVKRIYGAVDDPLIDVRARRGNTWSRAAGRIQSAERRFAT